MQLRYVRQKVLCVSIIMGAYVVIHPIVEYTFDVAELVEALNEVRRVVPFGGSMPSAAAMLMSYVPSILMGAFIGLLVPLCGYLGVKRNNSPLLCLFCGCNALGGCCSILTIVGLGLMMLWLQASSPHVQAFLDTCDPAQCVTGPGMELRGPNPEATVPHDQAVDCLATAAWNNYSPTFPKQFHLPQKCPTSFLKCKPPPEVPHYLIAEDGSVLATPDGERVPPYAAPAPSVPTRGLFGLDGGERHFARMGGSHFEGRHWEARHNHEAPPKYGHRDGMRDEEDDFHKEDAFNKGRVPAAMNPIRDCEPVMKRIATVHHVFELVPVILPKLMVVILVKLALTLPVACLGCLGFCWGKDLHSRMHQGYSHFAYPPQTQLQVFQHWGVAQPVTAVDPAMGQPLMLHAPPPPQAYLAPPAGEPVAHAQQ